MMCKLDVERRRLGCAIALWLVDTNRAQLNCRVPCRIRERTIHSIQK